MRQRITISPGVLRILNWSGRIGVTALVVYAANRSVAWPEVRHVLAGMRPAGAAAVVMLGIAGLLLHASRWRRVLATQDIAVTRTTALRTYLWGSALALVTPGRVGEFARGLGLSDRGRLTTVVATAIEKFYLVGAVAVGGCIGWGLHLAKEPSASRMALMLIWPVFFGAGFAAAAWRGSLPPWRRKPWSLIVSAWDGLRNAHSRQGGILQLNALGAHLTLILQTVMVLKILGGGSLVDLVMIACQGYALMVVLPVSIGNMGIREFALGVYWTAAFGARGGEAASVCLGTSLVILVVNVVAPAIFGSAWAALTPRRVAGKPSDDGPSAGCSR